jgi:site-specific DNA recombinase
VSALIREIRLVPAGGVLAIELTGDLAGILALSAGASDGGSAASKALQIKMVAGAGFEPTTFRL